MANEYQRLLPYCPETRIVVRGHTAHISRGTRAARRPSLDWAGVTAMGWYLNEAFDDDYYAVGFDFKNSRFRALAGREEFEISVRSVESPPDNARTNSFAAIEEPLFFVDFNSLLGDDRLATWFESESELRSIRAVC